jgi:transglutaminase-like putative cysteine protease
MRISGHAANEHPENHGSKSLAPCTTTRRALWTFALSGLCAILLFPSAAGASSKDTVPDWVHAAATQALPIYPLDTKAVVLLDDVTYTVTPDGRAVEHVRRVVKILRPQGRKESVVRVEFDKDTKILSMNVWSIGPDGHEYAMKDKEMSDEAYGGGILFDDNKYRVAHAPAADPGAVIAYEYEQRIRPYVTEETWLFQDEIPHLHESFTLQLPAGYTYGTTWAHHPATQPADTENHGWRWEMKDVPAIDLERVPMPPADWSLAGRMTVHYAGPGVAYATDGTWKSIGEWYGNLAKDRLVATPEIAAKAAELTAGKTDFYDKTEAIAEFVQKDIRYFAIEMGVGGYQPHAAADVFRNRYGDCKDKATLLSAMLSTVGIHAALVMVDTERGVVDPDAPSLVGDHMITGIEIPSGYTSPRLHSIVTAKSGRRYLIFDPTWDKTAFGQLEHNLQGGYGILMENADTQAIAFPPLDPALNTIRRTAVMHLDSDGVLKGTVTDKRFGDLSEFRRDMYTSGDAKEQREYLDHVLEHDFTSFSASDVKAENVGALNQDLTLTYSLSADRYSRSMGPLLMVRPRVLGTISSLGFDPDRKERKVPIDLGQTMQVTDDYTIELPEGYAVDELPNPVKIDLDFASYRSAFDVKGNALHYTRTFTVRELTLPADRYADVQKLVGIIGADEEARAILKKQ